MNTLGIALLWCIVQVTVLGLVAGGLYLLLRRLRPAAAAPWRSPPWPWWCSCRSWC